MEYFDEPDRNEIKTQGEADLKARQRAKNRLNYMKELQDKEDNEKDEQKQEEAREEIENFGLSISKRVEIEIQLSTGGDADGFKIYFDEAGEAVKGLFYWADWGQYAEHSLTDEQIDFVVDFYMLEAPLKFLKGRKK